MSNRLKVFDLTTFTFRQISLWTAILTPWRWCPLCDLNMHAMNSQLKGTPLV